MIETAARWMWELSLGTSLPIALLLAARPWLAKRYSAKWRYWMWLALAGRLLIPFKLPQREGRVLLRQPDGLAQTLALPGGGAAGGTAVQPAQGGAGVGTTFSQLLAFAWLVGAVLFLLYHFIGWFVFYRQTKRWSRLPGPETAALLADLQGAQGRVRLLVCPKVGGPLLTGLVHPVILLPDETLPIQELALILRHELVHARRRDLWYKLALLLAQALHWWNPLVWGMVWAARLDLELCCDDEALRGADAKERGRYGDAMLAVLRGAKGHRFAFTTDFRTGPASLRRRLENLFDTRPKARGGAALCAALVVVGMSGGLVACGGQAGGALTFPYEMGNAKFRTADGAEFEVKLRMTDGETLSSDDPDFLPGGGLQEGDNYLGKYELAVFQKGELLSQMPVKPEEGADSLIFYGPVKLKAQDYTGDGNPEICLGNWLWSGGNWYNLYTLLPDGTLKLAAQGIRHDGAASLSVDFEKVENGFAALVYSNADGEAQRAIYQWDGDFFAMQEG